MTSMISSLQKPSVQKLLFDACAGLSGTETLNQYPCVYDADGDRQFFVWLGDTEFSLFTKSVFMNLCNFAEEAGARSVTFLVFHQHRQKTLYRNMFRVIDAKRLGTDAVKQLIGVQDTHSAKAVQAATLFYQLPL